MRPEIQSRTLLPIIVLGGVWLVLCRHLAGHWAANEQYSYGWLVPPLAILLAWRRWDERPAPEPASGWGKRLMIVSAAVFFPAWLIAQPSPDWRAVSWLLAATVVGLLLGIAAILGGPRWARHFAFPICFIFTAVPWPSDLEIPLISGLMQLVAATTVALLNALGTLAVQQGNLIETRAGVLGIDEACSGVRSLQATVMIALFLAEFYRFRWQRALALLGAGMGIAFVTNVARAFFLSWTAARSGLAAVARWHDPAGLSVAILCFLLVAALAAILARDASAPAVVRDDAPLRLFPVRFIAGLGAWYLLVLVGAELWFHKSGPASARGPSWTFAWPEKTASGFQEIPLEPRAAQMLRASESRTAEWLDPTGAPWMVYHFRWAAGSKDARILAHVHHPENCLPSAGWQLEDDRGMVNVRAGSAVLQFRALRFSSSGAIAHVWYCRSEDLPPGSEPAPAQAESARIGRLQAVLRRQRSLGQQVLEAVFLSPVSDEQADAAFQREIAARIEPAGG